MMMMISGLIQEISLPLHSVPVWGCVYLWPCNLST